MNLGISNIAWKPAERDRMYDIMRAHGAAGLEIAPALLFDAEPDPFAPSPEAARAVMRAISARGLQLISMQSLLFGVAKARLFGAADERALFETGLRRAIGLAKRFAIPNLVMGAPANRVVPESSEPQNARRCAIDVFRRLGDECLSAGTRMALEPVPASYGTNFLNTIGDTIRFVGEVDHPGVTINFDLGALHLDGEAAEIGTWISKARRYVSHVHISEPGLVLAPADPVMLATTARSILATGYDGWFSIEMRAEGEDNSANVETALARASETLASAGTVRL